MSPSYRRKTKSSRRPSSCSRRRDVLSDKHFKNLENSGVSPPGPAKPSHNGDVEGLDSGCNSTCSTPKAERFRIPEITTCPPAPKKRRIRAVACSLRRKPLVFFAPPDIDLFFYFALRGIPL